MTIKELKEILSYVDNESEIKIKLNVQDENYQEIETALSDISSVIVQTITDGKSQNVELECYYFIHEGADDDQ